MEAALVELALECPSRTVTYEYIAQRLSVSVTEVELVLLRAMDNGVLDGRIDAEYEHVVINSTCKPVVTDEKVRLAMAGLDRLDSQLTAELDTRKRSHDVLDDAGFTP